MLVFKIFSIKKTIQTAKEASNDPVGFGVQEFTSSIRILIIQTIIGVVILLAILGLFGFTSWVTEPSKATRVLFFVVLVSSTLGGIVFYFIYRWFQRISKKHLDNLRKKPRVDYEVKNKNI